MSKSKFIFILSFILIFIIAIPVLGQTRVGKFGVGVDGSMQYALGGGSVTASPGIGYGVNLSYSVMEYLGLRSKFTINQIGWKTIPSSGSGFDAITDLMSLNVYLSADLMPNNNFNPFIIAGGGLAFFDPKKSDGSRFPTSSSDLHFIGGVGADYFLDEFWSLTLMAEYVMTNSPNYVGSKTVTTANDTFLRGSLQIRYYFFDSAFITKLLEAQRERSKRSK